jgi:hypothetical protein
MLSPVNILREAALFSMKPDAMRHCAMPFATTLRARAHPGRSNRMTARRSQWLWSSSAA